MDLGVTSPGPAWHLLVLGVGTLPELASCLQVFLLQGPPFPSWFLDGTPPPTLPPRLSNKSGCNSFLTTFQKPPPKKGVAQEFAKVRESGLNWSSYTFEAQIATCVAFGTQRPKLQGPNKRLHQ